MVPRPKRQENWSVQVCTSISDDCRSKLRRSS